VLCLLVAMADARLASASRDAAAQLGERLYGQARTVWFQGHWGFQYYVQRVGFLPLDLRRPSIKAGDLIVIPEGNSNLAKLPEWAVEPYQELELSTCAWLTTMSSRNGAGFYADLWGPLPYVFGAVRPQHFTVYRALVASEG
jgi:hypothetical protein